MAKIFRKPSSIKLPQRNGEPAHDQYGQEQKGAVKCPRCGNVHFKRRWYGSLGDIPTRQKGDAVRRESPKITKRELCPACKIANEHLFEGELTVEKVPAKYRVELLRLLRNLGVRARKKDPQDRIIAIERKPGNYRVTTTENQLAVRMAKKIKEVFAPVDLKISFSRDPYKTARATIVFPR